MTLQLYKWYNLGFEGTDEVGFLILRSVKVCRVQILRWFFIFRATSSPEIRKIFNGTKYGIWGWHKIGLLKFGIRVPGGVEYKYSHFFIYISELWIY